VKDKVRILMGLPGPKKEDVEWARGNLLCTHLIML
jgi:hypothetical protein